MGVPSIMSAFARWEFPLSLSSPCSGAVTGSACISPMPCLLFLGQQSIFSCFNEDPSLLHRAVIRKHL